MIYSNQVGETLRRFHSYLDENRPTCSEHPASRVSEFWVEHFSDRRNFPSVREFLSFRREDFVYGIGDTNPGSLQEKQEEFQSVLSSIQRFVPDEFIADLREPVLGAPLAFPFWSNHLSTSFVLNAGTTWRVKQLLQQFGPKGPLDIAEIGAGWGACAMQLHQACEVNSYTVIDLPENLCLSSSYLSLAHTDRATRFVGCGTGAPVLPQRGCLDFGLPPAIDRLQGPYHLILNTLSFQEMDQETVFAYLDWARRSLADGGLLISFNAHDKAGITHASQYVREGLELLHMAPFRKVPAGWFNTIPYEMVFRRAEGKRKPNMGSRLDILGELIQLGLDEDLAPWVDSVLRSSADDACVLDDLAGVFYAADESARREAMRRALRRDDAVTHFVAGNLCYCQGDFATSRDHLERCVTMGILGFARLRAQAMLHTLGAPVDHDQLMLDAAGLARELGAILAHRPTPALQDHIARVLDCKARHDRSNLWTLMPRMASRAWREIASKH